MKGFLSGLFLLLLLGVAQTATAEAGPYIGFLESWAKKKVATHSRFQFKKKDGSDHYVVGVKFFPYCLSTEIGVTNFHKDNRKNAFVDALGYLPVNSKINGFASVGLGRVFDSKSHLKESHRIAMRAGVGAQLRIVEPIAFRLFFQHQAGDKTLKRVSSLGAGLLLGF